MNEPESTSAPRSCSAHGSQQVRAEAESSKSLFRATGDPTELQRVIETKIAEARGKQAWHFDHRFYVEAEYFDGWANGLTDLLKTLFPKPHKGRPARNADLSGQTPSAPPADTKKL